MSLGLLVLAWSAFDKSMIRGGLLWWILQFPSDRRVHRPFFGSLQVQPLCTCRHRTLPWTSVSRCPQSTFWSRNRRLTPSNGVLRSTRVGRTMSSVPCQRCWPTRHVGAASGPVFCREEGPYRQDNFWCPTLDRRRRNLASAVAFTPVTVFRSVR